MSGCPNGPVIAGVCLCRPCGQARGLTLDAAKRRITEHFGAASFGDAVNMAREADAPDFRPAALDAFEARGFRREHRRTHGPDHFTPAEVAAFEARRPAPLTPAEMARLCREGEAADDAIDALMRAHHPMPVKRVLTRKESR